ncbi:MAG: rRNA maturation RNase YbeY [Pyrinomonadaceae bacterium]
MIVNLQRKIKIRSASLMPFVVALRAGIEEAEGGNFSVAFVSDKRMRELNGFFRGKDSTTDVLSFPHEPDEFETSHAAGFTADNELPAEGGSGHFLGDIVISAQQAERQAKENKLTLDIEIKQLILHGVLHLCGYDHETDNGEMNARELELRQRLSI